MSRLLSGFTIFLLAAISCSADCTCRKIEKGETTHWGGNELVIQVEEKSYKEIKGVVLAPDGPRAGALVEIWTNPEYLLRRGPQTPEEKAKQKRIKACRTGTDGKFCIYAKAGRYEVRVSLDSGWDVTKAYVVIDPQKGQDAAFEIHLVLGT
jgi:hypothetical protein